MSDENDKLIDIKSTKKGIEFTVDLTKSEAFVSHKSPPKDYPKSKKEYGDPANFKYPLDTQEHVRAAWSYINMPKNQKGYSSSQISTIKSRIKHAGKKYGIEFN